MRLFKLPAVRIACAALALGAALTTAAHAADGTVTAKSGLRLRTETNTSAPVITTLACGTKVEVLESLDGGWYKVTYNDRTGFVSGEYLTVEGEITPKLYGVVTASSLNLRSETNTESERISAIPSGATLEVLDAVDEEWYQVTYSGQTGYVSSQYVILGGNEKPTRGVVTASSLNVRATPSTEAEKVDALPAGTAVTILETLDGWLRIENGYVNAEYISIGEESVPTAESSSRQAEIVAFAKSFVGCRYVYGGTSPSGFDCSGLVYYVYRHFGYSLNRGATGQLKNGVTVSRSELQPGDLVFFNSNYTGVNKASHVGIYIGGGQFVHASAPGVGVVISDLNSGNHSKWYTTARRIV